jgi:hypothetical protein
VTFDLKVDTTTAGETSTWHVQADGSAKYSKGSCRDLSGAKGAKVTGVQGNGRTVSAQTIEVRK